MLTFAIITGLIIAVVAIVCALTSRHRQHVALRRMASLYGLSFSREDIIGIHDRFYSLNLIRQGHNRDAWNLLYGTTNTGLIAIFCYRYEIGLGVQRDQRRWWVGVLQSSQHRENWQARPKTTNTEPAENDHNIEIMRFRLTTDDDAAIEKLRQNGIEAVLKQANPADHIEVRDDLIAVATPATGQTESPQRLLSLLEAIAQMPNRTSSKN